VASRSTLRGYSDGFGRGRLWGRTISFSRAAHVLDRGFSSPCSYTEGSPSRSDSRRSYSLSVIPVPFCDLQACATHIRGIEQTLARGPAGLHNRIQRSICHGHTVNLVREPRAPYSLATQPRQMSSEFLQLMTCTKRRTFASGKSPYRKATGFCHLVGNAQTA
jgi:hypothetical protein